MEDVPSYGVLVQVDYTAGGGPRFSCQNEQGLEKALIDFTAFTRPQMRRKLEEWGFPALAELPQIASEEL